MSLNINEQPITDQLSQAIREMGDFLLDEQPSDEERFKNLDNKIDVLTTKANAEGYFDYKHNNSHRTLVDFLREDNASDLVKKYYSLPPVWKRQILSDGAKSVLKNHSQNNHSKSIGNNIIAGGHITAGGNIIVGENKISADKSMKKWYERPAGMIIITVVAGLIIAGVVFSLGWN